MTSDIDSSGTGTNVMEHYLGSEILQEGPLSDHFPSPQTPALPRKAPHPRRGEEEGGLLVSWVVSWGRGSPGEGRGRTGGSAKGCKGGSLTGRAPGVSSGEEGFNPPPLFSSTLLPFDPPPPLPSSPLTSVLVDPPFESLPLNPFTFTFNVSRTLFGVSGGPRGEKRAKVQGRNFGWEWEEKRAKFWAVLAEGGPAEVLQRRVLSPFRLQGVGTKPFWFSRGRK